MPAEASVCPPSSSSPSASSAAATVRLPGLACLLPLSTLSNVTALVSALFVLSQLSATRFLFTVSSSAGLPSSPPQPTSQTCLALFYRLSILLLRRLSTDCLASICAQAVLPSPSTPPGFSASGSRRASSATVQAAESRRRCVSSSSRRVANTSSAPSSAYRWLPFESAIASARVARTASSFFHKMKPDVSPSALREPSRIFGDSAHRGASPSPPQPHRFATRGSLSGMPNPRASQTASTSPAVGSVRRRSTSTTRRGFEAATAPEPHCVESGGSAAEAFPTPRRRLFDFNVACLAWQHMEDLLFETLSLLCVLSPHTAFAVSWRLALPVFFPRARARRGGDAGLLAVFHARAASADGGARAGDVEPDEDAAAELLPAQLLEELEVLSHGSTARAVLSYAASVRVLSSAQKKQAAGQRERSQGGDLLGDFPARVALLDASASRVLSSPSDRLRLSADGEGEAAAALRPRGGLSPPSPERGLGPSGSRGEHGAETDAAGRLTRRHLTTTASCGELVYRRMTQILLLLSRLCTAGGRDPREQGLAEALSERGGAPYGVALGAVKAVWRLAGVQEHLLFLVLGFLQQCFVAAAPRGSEALSARLLRLANTSGNVSFSSPLSSLCSLRARLLESGILDALINAALEALEKKDVLFLSSSPASSSSSSASSTAVLGSAAKAGDRGTASPLSPRGLFRLLAVVAAGLNAKHEKRADVLRVAAQLGAHVRALLSEFATRSLPASLKRQTSSPPPFALAEEGARDKPPFSPFVGSGARPSHALQVRLVGCLRCLQAVCATAGVAGDRRSLACLFAASPHFAACGGGGDSPPHEIAGAHASRVLLPALRQTTERRMRELYSPRLEFIIKGQHSTQSEIRDSMEIFLQALLIPSLPLASVAALLEFLASTVGCAAGSALSPSLAASAVLYKSSRLLLLSSPSFRAVPAFLLSCRLRPSLLEGVPADAAEASAGADEVRLASRLDGGDADQAFEEDADAFGGEQEATAGRDACAWRRAFRALLELMLTTFCADPRMGDARKLAKPTVCEALRLWHAKLAQTPQASGAETETPHEVYGDEALRELVWSVLQSLA
ncbi:hypothetical protein BESB_038050 [Besnoitia besnoiti]|uniref:Uncharacterized protein n=1 Tax=Besnoitia besnoiti TaxID=94643 RepID=A0A2A9MNC5_BESBE|nr:hypothetical protein BESB_038050 [Besnoitia besnoiti]PFH37347.1 hypothetical protein BESB_038050 [Besnoitia besnoiti]